MKKHTYVQKHLSKLEYIHIFQNMFKTFWAECKYPDNISWYLLKYSASWVFRTEICFECKD